MCDNNVNELVSRIHNFNEKINQKLLYYYNIVILRKCESCC